MRDSLAKQLEDALASMSVGIESYAQARGTSSENTKKEEPKPRKKKRPKQAPVPKEQKKPSQEDISRRVSRSEEDAVETKPKSKQIPTQPKRARKDRLAQVNVYINRALYGTTHLLLVLLCLLFPISANKLHLTILCSDNISWMSARRSRSSSSSL